jgi:hypothetical protein
LKDRSRKDFGKGRVQPFSPDWSRKIPQIPVLLVRVPSRNAKQEQLLSHPGPFLATLTGKDHPAVRRDDGPPRLGLQTGNRSVYKRLKFDDVSSIFMPIILIIEYTFHFNWFRI